MDLSQVEDEIALENVQYGDKIVGNLGYKEECPLNQLKSFHTLTSLPPDLLHDWCEGDSLYSHA